jgi:predicted transposase/invertase (TIGR01784 family)
VLFFDGCRNYVYALCLRPHWQFPIPKICTFAGNHKVGIMNDNSKQIRVVRFDWAMKNLLRNKANYDIVEGFLSALLEDNELKVIEILESESNKDSMDDKFNQVDVLVKDYKGRNILIEIQNTRESDYLYRMVYGASKNIAQSIKSGDRYRHINKVISVSVLYFNLGIGDDYIYYGQTEFVGMNTHERISKDSEKVRTLIPKEARYNQIEIFPEYYLIQVDKYPNVVKKAIDEWVYWFKNEKVKDGSSSKHIDKVEDKLNLLKMNEKDRESYNRFLEKMASEIDIIETAYSEGEETAALRLKPLLDAERKKAEQERKKAEQERKKAEQERKKAEQERQRAEDQKRRADEEKQKADSLHGKLIQTVKKLMAKGHDLESISEITGLDVNEIRNLKI